MAVAAPVPQWLQWVSLALAGALFLVVCIWLVKAGRRRSHRRLWAPLAPVVDGTYTSEHLHSTLTGTYRGRRVRARRWITGPDLPGGYSLELETPLRCGDWAIEFGSDRLFERDHWRVKAQDRALAETLEASGLLPALARVPTSTAISYDRHARVLVYAGEPVRLTAQEFEGQLELLLQIESLATVCFPSTAPHA